MVSISLQALIINPPFCHRLSRFLISQFIKKINRLFRFSGIGVSRNDLFPKKIGLVFGSGKKRVWRHCCQRGSHGLQFKPLKGGRVLVSFCFYSYTTALLDYCSNIISLFHHSTDSLLFYFTIALFHNCTYSLLCISLSYMLRDK